MTTATRTQPDHGTRACYLRGCRRPECADAHYRYMSRYRLDRERGQRRRTDAAAVAEHVRQLSATGWSHRQIADAAQCSERIITSLALGTYASTRADLATRILAAQPRIALAPPTSYVDATGTIRRIRALVAVGHSIKAVAEAVGIHKTSLGRIVNHEHARLTARHAQSVARVYKRLSTLQGDSAHARMRAARLGWAPPAAWDDDTLDDPSATPDWTGFCGTDRGYWTHKLQKLPMCPPCAAAHQQWIDDHANLDPVVRNQQQFAARAAAGTRGADIAHDGRELMRLGCDYEQAAARLGVTRQHLQQELQRHPEKAAA
ncbi:helix-turn-helix domain-containing protein [Streptomyces sp. LN590]|uniref:helix-turn-helix domain-containing protein n=1 Tax=Streptomyces sp. LN590 TaxID=3112980 RepID=UPI0037175C9C